jgi:hypothetical protein
VIVIPMALGATAIACDIIFGAAGDQYSLTLFAVTDLVSGQAPVKFSASGKRHPYWVLGRKSAYGSWQAGAGSTAAIEMRTRSETLS